MGKSRKVYVRYERPDGEGFGWIDVNDVDVSSAGEIIILQCDDEYGGARGINLVVGRDKIEVIPNGKEPPEDYT